MGHLRTLKRTYRSITSHLINSMFGENYHLDSIVFPGERANESQGVYFIFDDSLVLLYIGQSKNIKQRLHNHHIYRRDHHLIGIWNTSTEDERLATEKWLIQRHEPPLNIQYLEHRL